MNGAFRPKGGNGVHGLCDDAGMPRKGQGVLVGDESSPLPENPTFSIYLFPIHIPIYLEANP